MIRYITHTYICMHINEYMCYCHKPLSSHNTIARAFLLCLCINRCTCVIYDVDCNIAPLTTMNCLFSAWIKPVLIPAGWGGGCIKICLTSSTGIYIIKIRLSHDRFIFKMESIPDRRSSHWNPGPVIHQNGPLVTFIYVDMLTNRCTTGSCCIYSRNSQWIQYSRVRAKYLFMLQMIDRIIKHI